MVSYWELNLACPYCKGIIKIVDSSLFCKHCQKIYSIVNGVPCFIEKTLTEHQKSELEHYSYRIREIRSKNKYYNQTKSCYEWVLKWINPRTINNNSKIICIGGSYLDDLPHVKSNFKFNVDHLSHQYIKIFPEIINANVKYIASKSETFPFKDEYADIIYSRNSLDHVSNPIKTLLEIYRVLKPDGKFFLSVYYNSFFVNPHETTSIDNEFVENHLKNLFNIEWIQIRPSGLEKHIFSDWWLRQAWFRGPNFSKPNREKLGWLFAVFKKKKKINPYNNKILDEYKKLISNFHSALYYQEKKEFLKAAKFFKKILNSRPFLQTDKKRILYSKIQYLSITDHQGFKKFFNKFKLINKDIFWWMIVVKSSLPFMEKKLHEAIKSNFSVREYIFLEKYIESLKKPNTKKKIFKIEEKIYRRLFTFPTYLQSIYYTLEQFISKNI